MTMSKVFEQDDVTQVDLSDVVRLRKPFYEYGRFGKEVYTHGIVTDIVSRDRDGRAERVCLHVYNPETRMIALMPNGEPDYLDFHRDEFDVVWPARVEEERRANHR
jgi:hypothetical protein